MNRKNKKGQVGGADNMVGLVLVVGIALLLMIFVSALGGQVYETVEDDITEIGTETPYNNDTFVPLKNATGSFDRIPNNGSLFIYNGTAPVGLGNFTINYTFGTFVLADTSVFNSSTLTATYTYNDPTIRGHVFGAIEESFSALEKTGSYMPLLVLASIIGIVLITVLGFTRFGSNGGSVL